MLHKYIIMKFLSSLIERYKKLEVAPPQWVQEYVTPTPGTAIPAQPVTSTTTSSPLQKSIDDALKVKNDPELEQRKKELDVIYKQVADVLKKKAQETANTLKQTAANLAKPTTPVSPTAATPTVVPKI